MGWLELLGWLKAMRRQQEGRQPSPDSWDVEDPWFEAELARARQGR